jgi:DNA-binding transcriptional MerR regulator
MSLVSRISKTSGIKAHTIRIWEKYNVLQPMRTDTNIMYDQQVCKKLLNITLLHEYGYKHLKSLPILKRRYLH